MVNLNQKGKLKNSMRNLESVKKDLGTVLKEFEQRVLAKVAKIHRYNKRIKQYKQNQLFTIDQKN